MKNKILYNYNIYVTTIVEKYNNYSFIYRGESFILQLYDRPVEELDSLRILSSEMQNRNIQCHSIIPTVFNKLYIEHNNKNYVLLKINIIGNRTITFDDIINFNYQPSIEIINKLNKSNWKELWQNKIDYFEYQFDQMNEKHILIKESINYYIGLWENAISYLNNYYQEKKLVVCHKRIDCKDSLFSFYNPLNFVIDTKERDVADYLKSCFFDKNEEVYISPKIKKLDPILLISRLLFPSYYFDLYEKIINGKEDEKSLENIIVKAKLYEIFLKNIFILFKDRGIILIDWIIKK